jgi:16S rRNA (cytidine1402-2'-O)-methyltransferase
MGDRRVALCRELTKLHEQILRGTVSEMLERPDEPRGEYTVVIAGAQPVPDTDLNDAARERLRLLHDAGGSAREATALLAAELGLSRRQLYQAWTELDRGSGRR